MGNLLSVGSLLNSAMYIGIALLVLLLMITIHELGHYTAGKILKFKINEFSVGFGKSLFSKTLKNGEKFSIRLIPLGGFCAFEGEDSTDEKLGTFNSHAPWKRLIVLFSGAFFNFVSAIFFCLILLATMGNGQVAVQSFASDVNQGADKLLVGDVITHVDGTKLSFLNGGLVGVASSFDIDEEFNVTVVRDGEKINVTLSKYAYIDEDGNVVLTDSGEEYAVIGITTSYQALNFGMAILQSIPFAFEMAWECLSILGQLLIGAYGLQDIGGPITTIGAIADAGAASMLNLLLLMPLIAVNLAVFNLLPIPALDGARMIFVIIEWIRKKPINRDIEAKIHTVGLIVLMSFVLIVDILHLIVF